VSRVVLHHVDSRVTVTTVEYTGLVVGTTVDIVVHHEMRVPAVELQVLY